MNEQVTNLFSGCHVHSFVVETALIPRYVRVNTIQGTLEEVLQSFRSRGYVLSDPFSSKSDIEFHVWALLTFLVSQERLLSRRTRTQPALAQSEYDLPRRSSI